ncbi:MAG: hypothetical protein H7832_11145 [Magnetococcus sp. DMHC-6]
MISIQKAFFTTAIDIDGKAGIFSGIEEPSQIDLGDIPTGSLYLRTTGKLYLKVEQPTQWQEVQLMMVQP